MQTTLNEKIEVLAKFKDGQITPLLFKFSGRTIKIESIDLKYDFLNGNVRCYSFSVSNAGNSYKITYNSKELEWTLGEVWT